MRRRLAGDTWVLVLGCGFAIGFTIWLTAGIWQPGVPFGDDNAAHVARTSFALDHVFPSGRPDGWDPTFGLGYQEFLFVGPLFQLVAGLLKLLSLGTLSNLAAFKATVVLSYVALPPAVAFLAWAFGLGKRAAGIAAVLSLLVSSPLGGAGLQAVFETGLATNQMGSPLWCLALGSIVLLLRRPTNGRIVFAGAMVALVIVSHILTTIVLAIFVGALLIAAGIEWLRHRRRRERLWSRLRALALAAVLAGAFSAFVSLPLLLHGNLRGVSTAFPDVGLGDRLPAIWEGTFLFRPYVAVWVVAGLVFELVYSIRHRRLFFTVLLTPIVFLAMARLLVLVLPGNIIALQLTNRAWGFVGLLAVLPLAHLLSWLSGVLLGWFGRLAARAGDGGAPVWRRAGTVVALAVPMLVAIALVIRPPNLARETVRPVAPTDAALAITEVLRSVVPDGARFATQRVPGDELGIMGMTHPDLWLAAASERNTLNIWNAESSSVLAPVFEAEHLSDGTAEEEADKLARYGVTHVVLLRASAAPDLLSSGRFRPVWGASDLRVLEVLPPTGHPTPRSLVGTAGPASALLLQSEPEHVRMTVTSSTPTSVTLAVGWSPKWHVTVNGEPVDTVASDERLLAVDVPAGTSTVELRYASDAIDWIGRAITLVAVAFGIAWLVRSRRQRRGRTLVDADPSA